MHAVRRCIVLSGHYGNCWTDHAEGACRPSYNKDLAMGSLAGAGTRGFLIPPSIPMIVYCVLTNLSIP